MLETNAKDFKDFRGLDILIELMNKCLDESNNTLLELLPFALECLKIICIHDPNFIQILREDKEMYQHLLYILTRSLYIYHDCQNVLEQIVVSLMLILYHDWLKYEVSYLSMPKFMLDKLNFPIEVNSVLEPGLNHP